MEILVPKLEIKVSVLLAVYNHEKYLRRSIESILKQKTDFKYELLIHDDASTDGSIDIIKEYKSNYPDIITVVFQKENQFRQGKYHVEEHLIPYGKGNYVAFLEGDDFWCDELKLQRQFDALEKNLDCAMCVHKTQSIDVDGNNYNEVLGEGGFIEGVIQSDLVFKSFFIDNQWPFQTSSYFIRSEVFLERPYFWEKFYVGDLPTIMWAAHKGNIFFIDKIMSCYRRFVSGSATLMNRDKAFQLHKSKTNAEGLIAFNDVTDGKYWSYLKHITCNYLYQYYKGSGKVISSELLKEARKELHVLEKIKLSFKYTKFGYMIRNIFENLRRQRMKK